MERDFAWETIPVPAYATFPEDSAVDPASINSERVRCLEEFVADDAADLFDTVAHSSDGAADVETGAPRFESIEEGWRFEPEGWIGRYPGRFNVEQRRVNEETFDRIQSQVTKWVETAGAATARSLLRFLPDIALTTANSYRSYSQQLIEETEAVLTHRPPVDTEFTREKGLAPRGRPLPAQSIRKRSTGRVTTVSQRVNFTFDTLANLLLIRFHLAMAGALVQLTESVPSLTEKLAASISYHREFVSGLFSAELTERALQIDFDSPRRVAETRRGAPPEMGRVIDLWKGFRNQTPLAVSITERLETAIRPVEKIYELYVLSAILDVLRDVTEAEPEFDDAGLGSPIRVDRFTLRYDLWVPSAMSRFLVDGFNTDGTYRPDYLLLDDNEPIWIGDAKFKRRLEKPDGERFLRYMIDLLPAGEAAPRFGTILAPTVPTQMIETSARDYQIEIVQLSPNSATRPLSRLTEWLGSLE